MKTSCFWGDLTDASAEKVSMEFVQYADVPAKFKMTLTSVRKHHSS